MDYEKEDISGEGLSSTGKINKWENCSTAVCSFWRERALVNMQQETLFDFCKESLTSNRLMRNLQRRNFYTCLPSDTQLKKNARAQLKRSKTVNN